MSQIGLFGLLIGFASLAVSIVCLAVGGFLGRKKSDNADTLTWAGHIAAILTFACLTFCCVIILVAFLSGDNTIEYVVQGRSHQEGMWGVFFRISGLWEGREGSLLFWAWLISLFTLIMTLRNVRKTEKLDSMAIMVMQIVCAVFVGLMLFSEANSPFIATKASYLNPDGSLTAAASVFGMNPLLEHWAMAVHPPALFIGYAGLTVPFAYAIATLILGDSSDAWVRKCQRYLMVAWVLLGVGIGLGSLWAYVVLGWGGYWGWDAVENASFFPWLVGVALIHSLTVYRKRGAFKRWAIMCTCVTFAFVISGTFISRSGLVQSVHAFEGDPVSLGLFGGMIVVSLLAGIVGLALRWKRFAPKNSADEAVESLVSREAAYYFNNVIMVAFACVICYLTIAQALPSWLPFGGQSITAGTYNAVARPLGIVYCAVIAVCPLLGWMKTDKAEFVKRAKIPAICAVVLFVVLMVYWANYLVPSYNATIAAGGTIGEGLANEGPAWYYNGLAAVGFLVASLLFFNTLFLIGRTVSKRAKAAGTNPVRAFFGMWNGAASKIGGYIAHLAMSVILVGLICSSMYVTENASYLAYDEGNDSAPDLTIQDYTLKYTGNSIDQDSNNVFYYVDFDVYRGDQYVGHVSPNVQLVATTQQSKSNAAVIHFADEDLFVVYRGVNNDGDFSMDVRVNPQISLVWAGFFMLIAGGAIAALGRREPKEARVSAEGGAAAKSPASVQA